MPYFRNFTWWIDKRKLEILFPDGGAGDGKLSRIFPKGYFSHIFKPIYMPHYYQLGNISSQTPYTIPST